MPAPAAPTTDEARLRQNLLETRLSWTTAPYYAEVEGSMDGQWRDIIWPLIDGCDFAATLDLAAGHGRNSNKLKDLARELWIVDINQTCIDACKARFAAYRGPCRMHFHVNDGASLAFIPDSSLTLVYSWDAAVHFDKRVIEKYIHEFARIMKPGARGFLHHSNYGTIAPDPESNWMKNPSWRSTMTADLMREYCRNEGLEVLSQSLMDWNGVERLDCISTFRKI